MHAMSKVPPVATERLQQHRKRFVGERSPATPAALRNAQDYIAEFLTRSGYEEFMAQVCAGVVVAVRHMRGAANVANAAG